jgi:hypothetical protein
MDEGAVLFPMGICRRLIHGRPLLPCSPTALVTEMLS